MAIFNSYVSLPEGNMEKIQILAAECEIWQRFSARIEQQSRQLDPISAHSKSRMNFLQVVCTHQEWWKEEREEKQSLDAQLVDLRLDILTGPCCNDQAPAWRIFFWDLLSATGGITKSSSTIGTKKNRIWPCDSPLTESWPYNRSVDLKPSPFWGHRCRSSFPLIN
jgi:hypothetical protein